MPQDNDPPNGSPPKESATPPGGLNRRTFEIRSGRATMEMSGFHEAATPPREHIESHPTGTRLAVLSLGALGVVYGDIGTSPLYAVQAAFTGKHGFAPT